MALYHVEVTNGTDAAWMLVGARTKPAATEVARERCEQMTNTWKPTGRATTVDPLEYLTESERNPAVVRNVATGMARDAFGA